jgi:hypothetical protein
LLPFLFSLHLVLPIFSTCFYCLFPLFFFYSSFSFFFPPLILITISCPSPLAFVGDQKNLVAIG